jgi:hypothetical protein
VVGATITVRIDRGYGGGQQVSSKPFTTGVAGEFSVWPDIAEPRSSWGTLMIRKDGFTQLDVQFKGGPNAPVELCVTAVMAP